MCNNSTFKSQRRKENKAAYQALKTDIFPPKPRAKKLIIKLLVNFLMIHIPLSLLKLDVLYVANLKKYLIC